MLTETTVCDSHILSGIRGYLCESRTTDNEPAEQTGPADRADLGLQEQLSECNGLVEEIIKGQIKELVRGSVEETLNSLLEEEAKKLTQAALYGSFLSECVLCCAQKECSQDA